MLTEFENTHFVKRPYGWECLDNDDDSSLGTIEWDGHQHYYYPSSKATRRGISADELAAFVQQLNGPKPEAQP